MEALSVELEHPWRPGDPSEVCFFGRADIVLSSMEARDIAIRIDDEFFDLVELSVAQTFDGEWAWMSGVDECGGVVHSRESACSMAEDVGWDLAIGRIRDLVMSTQTKVKLYEIARLAALRARSKA